MESNRYFLVSYLFTTPNKPASFGSMSLKTNGPHVSFKRIDAEIRHMKGPGIVSIISLYEFKDQTSYEQFNSNKEF